MPYVRDSFWRGREFTSVEHMQAESVTWSKQVAGRRQCRPLGGAAPMAAFETVEADTLLPLPPTPFVLARWSTATVGPDIHIKVGRTLYSVPWKLIGRRVDVRSTATVVQVFLDGQLVKTHAALEQGKRTDKSDYPPEKIAFLSLHSTSPWSPCCRTTARRFCCTVVLARRFGGPDGSRSLTGRASRTACGDGSGSVTLGAPVFLLKRRVTR